MKLIRPKNTRGLVITKGHSGEGKSHHPKRSEKPVDFIGVDGEGVTDADGHRYVLFGVGEHQIADENGLTYERVFDFLYGFYRPSTAFVGFYLGYDFSQIIKTMPENSAWMLLTNEGRLLRKHRIANKPPHPVQSGGWQYDVLGNKRLRIRPKGCSCENATCKCDHDPWLYLCDAGPFFQSSFLSVIDPTKWHPGTEVVSPEEFQLIREGKENRSTAVLDASMRMYNQLENVVLSRVMRTVDTGFHGIGIHLTASKWFGPGQAAQAWLRNEKAPTGEQIRDAVPDWFLEAARMTYFGGWFEPFMHGIIPGECHEYDVNSAYPSIIANLPCLLHGKYTHGNGKPPYGNNSLLAVSATVWSESVPGRRMHQHIGAMLHRDSHGRILRPLATKGWYWWDELQAAKDAGCVKRIKVEQWVKYEPCDCPPPMGGIADLYVKRLEVGKTSPLGKSAKLTYNSAYGKNAQSIGDPMFGNPVYASRITSGCRTRILEAIGSHPGGMTSVCMIATDAVYFLSPHSALPLSENLGEWEHKTKSSLTIFKPGVYWDDKTRAMIAAGESAQFKARGFKASDFAAQIAAVDDVFRSWTPGREVKWPTVKFQPAFTMVTALQALRRHDWQTAGKVTQGNEAKPLVQNADPSEKRDPAVYADVVDGRTVWRSRPYAGVHMVEGRLTPIASCPYEKRFGMEDPFSDEYRSQLGETPDGFVGDIVAQILKGE